MRALTSALLLAACLAASAAQDPATLPAPAPARAPVAGPDSMLLILEVQESLAEASTIDTLSHEQPIDMDEPLRLDTVCHYSCPYFLPYSFTHSAGNWKRLWLNTAVLCGAYVASLGVLELLPEDATAWNRAEIQQRPPFNRWWRNVMVLGPEWDHDKFYFNYLLHPYAGAVYFMGARSCGFNFWQSLLYSAMISTVGWEFGIEAFMERPSYQDIFITPLVGSAIGEGFYILKRKIVQNDYELAGSKVLGNIVAFIIDPVNEVIGLFAGNDCRRPKPRLAAAQAHPSHRSAPPLPDDLQPVSSFFWINGSSVGIGLSCQF